MDRVRVAYRDVDRTPFIYCVREMAARHYDVDVEILQIRGTLEYEDALFDGSTDVIVEHLEYLYEEAAKGRKVTMFCAPVLRTELDLVVPGRIQDVSELRGQKIAIRAQGRPFAAQLRLRTLGILDDVSIVIVPDAEVGRWAQWKLVQKGDCAATFVSHEYLPAALEAGLKVLPVPNLPVVGHFHHACTTQFARANDDVMRRYVAAVIHAICLMKYRPDEAMEIVEREPKQLINLESDRELRRRFECIADLLEPKPYPTIEAMANTFEIATAEWPGGKGINPLALWDLHWVKQLDDEGFIDRLIQQMSPGAAPGSARGS